MKILVVAEHENNQIKPATLHAVGAAQELIKKQGSGSVELFIAGNEIEAVASSAAKMQGLSRVLRAEATYLADQTAENLAASVKMVSEGFTHIIFAATAFGKNVSPRVAALLDVAQISDVISIQSADTFVRPIYAGNALATMQSLDAVKVLTVRPTNFEAVSVVGGEANVVSVNVAPDLGITNVIGRELTKSSRPALANARIVVSGGRGLASGENYQKVLVPLADQLGAALGASRAAVDAGYVPNDYQVGQTGQVVAPDLYIAVGISGAIQHLAGMKDSKVIVAINKDGDAPIFQVADYGLIGDLFELVPQLVKALEA